MYKMNSAGEILPFTEMGSEYYNSSDPYEGALIEYLNSLVDIADGDFNISYTHVSQASKRVHKTSSFTAAVQDIEDGLVDFAVGPFWITGERLQMTSYTVPLCEFAASIYRSAFGLESFSHMSTPLSS